MALVLRRRSADVLDPNCQIVVLHDIDDVHSASTALHHGARSCARPDATFGDDSVEPDPSEAAHRLAVTVASRTRFPIPLDYVMDRLCVPSDADVGLCYPLLQRAAFRSAGFDLDLEELATTHGHRGVLFGAFHSTRAVLQFLAERWWRTPRSILDELDAPRLEMIGHDWGLG